MRSGSAESEWTRARLQVVPPRQAANTPDPNKVSDVPQTFRQPITFYIAEVFKVMDGNIRQIEAVLTTVSY
jgi:hypothetical protein